MPAITKKQQIAKYQKMLNELLRKYNSEMALRKRHEEYLELQEKHGDAEGIAHAKGGLQQDDREILILRKQIFNIKKKLAKLGVYANTPGVR